jgi:stearoyl-CoA desaturase (delta-9 desaturase)
MAVVLFFLLHWWGSAFFQSLFHHRYASHRMFTMSPRVERAIHLMTYAVQGSSYLDVRSYALMHREHHAFSDTPRDPHSPSNHRNLAGMMLATARHYYDYVARRVEPETRFEGGIPEWPWLDRLGRRHSMRLMWIAAYTAFYVSFATATWQYLLLPVHFVMGPVHGAIVNWWGHRAGYRNYACRDQSRNTLPIDFVTMGELFQNNHHHASRNANFARRWFEIDPSYQIMKLMVRTGLIQLVVQPKAETIASDEPAQLAEAS